MRTPVPFTLAVVGLALLALPLGADPPVTRRYPIDEIIKEAREPEAQELGFYANGGTVRAEDASDDLDASMLAELVEALAAEGWESPCELRARDGWLVVCHTEAVQARVASLLAALRVHRSRPIGIALETYRLARPAVEVVLAGGPVLDAKRLAALEGATKVASQVLVGRVGHKLQASKVIHETFGVDATVEIATRSSIAQLERIDLATGRVADLRVVAAADGASMLVACTLDRSTRAPETVRHKLTLDPTNTLEVEHPRHSQERVRTQVVLPARGAAVLYAAGDAELTLVTIARHAAGDVAVDATELRKAGLGLWDARLLLYEPGAPAATQLGAGLYDCTMQQQGAVISLAAGSPFSEGDALVEDLVAAVAPQAWESSDNFVRLHDGFLVARAPADVLDAVGAWLAKREQPWSRGALLRGEVVVADATAATALAARVGQAVPWEGYMPAGATSEGIYALAVVARRSATLARFDEAYYIVGYQSEVAEGAAILDPDMRLYRAGRTLRVDGLDSEGGALACTFELGSARLDGIEARAMREGAPYACPRIVQGTTRGRIASGQATLLDLGDDRFLWVACDGNPAR